jgi:hypothetical protein
MMQNLDRNALAHEHVLSQVHAPHSTLTDQRIDAVAIGKYRPDPLVREPAIRS